jgi:hypothetical protein
VRARTLLALGLLAFALRAWPLHVFYQHPDQELLPDDAMAALVEGTWRPSVASYPMGQFDVLRAAYGVTYTVGYGLNLYHDRLDLLASYFEDPYRFFLVARVWACLAGVATVLMTAVLAARLGGNTCGIVAGLILALSFGHVRESHWGSLDAPAVAFMVPTLLVADHARRGGGRSIVVAGILSASRRPSYQPPRSRWRSRCSARGAASMDGWSINSLAAFAPWRPRRSRPTRSPNGRGSSNSWSSSTIARSSRSGPP